VLHFLAVETSPSGSLSPVTPKHVHFKGARIVPRIFLSYRRDDSGGHAGRLYDRLRPHFGRANLFFMDADTVPLGLDFVETTLDAVRYCNVLLAVIGRQWLTCTDPQGQRRLDNPEDLVRLEITTALEREIRVIPVLVGGASMPPFTELPDVLGPLTRRQALEVGNLFHPDVDRLIAELETVPGAAPLPTANSPTPRHLDVGQYHSMVATLRQFRGQKLRVLLLADSEPRQYGERIIQALAEAGWTLDVTRAINLIRQPTYGLHVYGPHPWSSPAIQALIWLCTKSVP
jgi:hypothetical protein